MLDTSGTQPRTFLGITKGNLFRVALFLRGECDFGGRLCRWISLFAEHDSLDLRGSAGERIAGDEGGADFWIALGRRGVNETD